MMKVMVTFILMMLTALTASGVDSATPTVPLSAMAVSATPSVVIPDASSAILDLAARVYQEHKTWQASFLSVQSLSSFSAQVKGKLEMNGDPLARIEFDLDLTGMSVPFKQKAFMNPRGLWGEQISFGKPIIQRVEYPANPVYRHEFLAQLIMMSGVTLGRMDLAEQLWWFRQGWDLELVDRDSLEMPGTIQFGGKMQSLTHAQEAMLQDWPVSQLDRLDLFLSQRTLFPVLYRVSDLGGKPIWEVKFEAVRFEADRNATAYEYTPPEGARVANVTGDYMKTVEKRMKIRNAPSGQ